MISFTAVYTPNFLREFDKLSSTNQKQVMKKIKLLENNPLFPSLRCKKLYGQPELFECSVNMDIRIIWQYDGDKIILLMDVGHHDILKKY